MTVFVNYTPLNCNATVYCNSVFTVYVNSYLLPEDVNLFMMHTDSMFGSTYAQANEVR